MLLGDIVQAKSELLWDSSAVAEEVVVLLTSS